MGNNGLRNSAMRGEGRLWDLLAAVDWTTVGTADLTGGGTIVAGGLTWTAEKGNKCSTFGPDGSTGLRFVQTSSGTPPSSTTALHTPLSGVPGTIETTDALLVQIRFTLGSNSGGIGAILRNGSYGVMGGTQWMTTQDEVYAYATATQQTDYSAALGGTSDRVLQLLYTAGALQVYNSGAWSGAWPTAPSGTMDAMQGESASSAKAATLVPLAGESTTLGLLSHRSANPSPDHTIIGTRLLRRSLAP